MPASKHSPKALLPILLLTACVVLGVYVAVSVRSIVCGTDTCDGPPIEPIPREPGLITLTGFYTCLPHQNVVEPQTEECAEGLQTHDGAYFALDFSLLSQGHPALKADDRLTATGMFTPVEALSSTHWWDYPIQGVFSVTDSITIHE